MDSMRFDFRYSLRLRWLLVSLGLGPRLSGVELVAESLRVWMGWAFRATIPLSAVSDARPERDVWWAIGVHTSLSMTTWLVNGGATGIVGFRVDPPARGRLLGVPVRIRRLLLGLEDPEGFLRAIARP